MILQAQERKIICVFAGIENVSQALSFEKINNLREKV
jgi:uncharacterized protein involved in tellurium resistance